ncbi:MAG: hypothetical protein JSW39_19670 [Desulfobacterales bacterium]|nr:MAG: hypothetical protein JSW39_19670 [Desulfobacterales bacterium]
MKIPKAMICTAVTLALASSLLAGCGARLHVVTGTSVGLSANSGDGQTRPPQVSLAYKRSEGALIPTEERAAVKSESPNIKNTDAFSSLAVFNLTTEWFGDTEINQFIATGHASRDIQDAGPEFVDAFNQATIGVVPNEIQAQRKALADKLGQLNENQAQEVLNLAGYQKNQNKTASATLQDYILHAQTHPALTRLEAAFGRLP